MQFTNCSQIRYSWTKDGDELNIDQMFNGIDRVDATGTLRFSAPGRIDEGLYQCIVSNDAGVAVSDNVIVRMASK